MHRVFIISIGLLALIAAARAQVDGMEEGRARAEAFLAGRLDAIWQSMTPELQRQLGSQANLAAFREQVRSEMGEEQEIRDEKILSVRQGVTTYRRVANWSDAPQPMLMEWSFDQSGRIAGFFIRAAPIAADSRFTGYSTQADLLLPFAGTWHVYWAGRSVEQNYHAVDPGQRFAYDFLVMKDGSSFAGDDPGQVERYYCWGEPILAPARGTVVAVANDLADNAIGQTDAAHPLGNHVILDLGNSEFAFLAHMQKGSVGVAPGDEVQAGDRLGACGNSGNSSEPHLHLHLQTTAELGSGEGLPAQFQDYRVNGTVFARGEPVKGQEIAPVAAD